MLLTDHTAPSAALSLPDAGCGSRSANHRTDSTLWTSSEAIVLLESGSGQARKLQVSRKRGPCLSLEKEAFQGPLEKRAVSGVTDTFSHQLTRQCVPLPP